MDTGHDLRGSLDFPGPIVRFMRDNINQLGGDIHSGNVRCRRCTTRQSGGFDPDYGIQICANQLRNRGHLEDTMAHGLQSLSFGLMAPANYRLRNGTCLRPSTLQGRLGEQPQTCCLYRNQSVVFERRVSIHARIHYKRTVEIYATASRVRKAAGNPFCLE
jgi:hypothetical protein